MARIRSIKPEFPHSESMGRVSRDARLTFILLWTIADDSGRLRGNSRMLASLLFPYDADAPGKIDQWLAELEQENCVVRYKVDGNLYIEICNWLQHQKIDKPSKSKIVPFANVREDSANGRRGFVGGVDQRNGSKDQGEDGKGVEGKGSKGKGAAKKLTPPTLEEVRQHCLERKNGIDPEAFVAHYEARGWRASNGVPIVKWKSAMVTWEKNAGRFETRKAGDPRGNLATMNAYLQGIENDSDQTTD